MVLQEREHESSSRSSQDSESIKAAKKKPSEQTIQEWLESFEN